MSHRIAEYGQAKISIPESMHLLASQEELPDSAHRKTKIVCTMGPACANVETIAQMIDNGMNVARLNFSHGDHESHGKTVTMIREACRLRPGKQVAILLDTKGPEIRTGFFAAGGTVDLVEGADVVLTTDYDFKGDASKFACSYPKLPSAAAPGQRILAADGSLTLIVKEKLSEKEVMCRVGNNCTIGERKNMNLPGVQVELPVLQEKDIGDLVKFGIPQGVDFVAASFVQCADDIKLIRETLGTRGRAIKIIAKIENEAGMVNFEEILEATDGVMVARGDLGMEIPTEKVFLAQKLMISKCNLAGKFVVTATQMLESMCKAPRPTRAEASDVANAVLDGTDCVMLSGETAGGAFPLSAVDIMRRICMEAESHVDHPNLYLNTRLQAVAWANGTLPTGEAVCSAAVRAAIDMKANLIIALTETGHTARMLAKFRPEAPLLAITASEQTARQLATSRGVTCLLTASFQGTDSVLRKAVQQAKEAGLVEKDDLIVALHGQREECPGQTNLMKVLPCP